MLAPCCLAASQTLRQCADKLCAALHGAVLCPVACCAVLHTRRVIILVQAGAPVDSTIDKLSEYMEQGDIIIDGGNEW